MKTSLVLDDSLFREAKREAERHHKTLSEVISHWARLGRDALRKNKKTQRPVLKSVDLGGPSSIDLNSRRDWLDLLER